MLDLDHFNSFATKVSEQFAEGLEPTTPTLTFTVMMMYPNISRDDVGEGLLVKLDEYEPPEGFELKEDNKFANCLFYKGALGGKRFSVKIFADASLHVTGATTDEHINAISEHFFDYISGITELDVRLERTAIQLISSTFKISKDVIIDRLGELLVDEPGIETHRDNLRYPGLKVRILQEDGAVEGKVRRKNLKCAAFVFRTGSINITGATSMAGLLEGYFRVLEMLHKHKGEVCIERVVKERASRKRKAEWELLIEGIANRLDASG